MKSMNRHMGKVDFEEEPPDPVEAAGQPACRDGRASRRGAAQRR